MIKLEIVLRALLWTVVIFLITLLVVLVHKAWPMLNYEFLTSYPSRFAVKSGVKSAFVGSLLVIVLAIGFAIPAGIAVALYLFEYAKQNSRWIRFIHLNISNLAGVPSVIYGVLGLTVYVRSLEFGRSILSGALTLATMALPLVILTTLEALKSVPSSLRQGALALGATRWQTLQGHVIPYALPQILTGLILTSSRLVGESAPLIMMGAMTFVAFLPQSIFDIFTVMPIQIYNWTSRPQEEFQITAAAGIVVLLLFVLGLNSVALLIRSRSSKRNFS